MTDSPNDNDFPLFSKFPREIQYIILALACIFQMQDIYGTNDYEELAKRVCSDGPSGVRYNWLISFLGTGVRIPDPPLGDRLFSAERNEIPGWTPIHIAAQACDIALIKRLLLLGYDINAVDSDGITAVHELAKAVCFIPQIPACQRLITIRALCELGADVTHRMAAYWDKPLSQHRGVAAKSYILREFIEAGWLPHMRLVGEAHVQVLELLIKHGAPLSQALQAVGHTDSRVPFIRPLLKAGADIEEVTHDLTPLAMAAHNRSLGVVRALLDAGANVNGAGQGVLFAAIEPLKSHYVYAPNTARTVRVLCDAGADTTRLNKENHSVLSFALTISGDSTKRHSTWDTVQEVVKAVCKGGANVNFHHRGVPRYVGDGDTPLHIATRASVGAGRRDNSNVRSECAEILIAYGADVNAQNDAGRTPLHSVVVTHDAGFVKVLLEHGAKLDVEDVEGRTALMLTENTEIATLLGKHKE